MSATSPSSPRHTRFPEERDNLFLRHRLRAANLEPSRRSAAPTLLYGEEGFRHAFRRMLSP